MNHKGLLGKALFWLTGCLFFAVAIQSHAIKISDYKVISERSGVVLITQLGGVEYIEVTVDISGQTANYELEQIDVDMVLVRVTDSKLKQTENLVTVTVYSPITEATRMFSVGGGSIKPARNIVDNENDSDVSATDGVKVDEGELATEQAINKTQVAANQQKAPITKSTQKPQIHASNTIKQLGVQSIGEEKRLAGYIRGEVVKIAQQKGYKLLELPGDEVVLDMPISGAVNNINALFRVNDGHIAQVHVDKSRQQIRVIPYKIDKTIPQRVDRPRETPLEQKSQQISGQSNQAEHEDSLHENVKPVTNDDLTNQRVGEETEQAANDDLSTPQQDEFQEQQSLISVRDLLLQYADERQIVLLQLPGDEVYLDKKVSMQPLTNTESLAKLAEYIGAVIDLDNTQKLLRVRSQSE